jgi:ribosome-associated protein
MIKITENISIDESEIREEFIRSSGPGGQNVNKVLTAVQLHFDIAGSSIPANVKERLYHIARNRISASGELLINARRYRTQEKNRKDALDRLVRLIRKASEKPKVRKKTKPTEASIERRLKEKRKRSEVKKMRNT